MELLQGEAAPESISVEVTAEEEKLFIDISYTLAAIDLVQNHTFPAQWSDTMSSPDPVAKQWDFSNNDSPQAVEPGLKLDLSRTQTGTGQPGAGWKTCPASCLTVPTTLTGNNGTGTAFALPCSRT